MNLNSAGGQNIVQPGGTNYLGMLGGIQGRNRAVKNKFALQKLVMDYGQQQRIERDELAHKHRDTENKNKEVYKVAAPLAGAGINFEQNSEHYGLAATRASGAKEGTPEFEKAKLGGAQSHWEHIQLAGLDKGSLGNGIIGANLQKEMFDKNTAIEEEDSTDVISGPDNKNPVSRTPSQFDAPEYKADRSDVAKAHIQGLITDEEANDHVGDNSFGSGTGNYSMSAEQVHRKAGLNTFGDSTRINEFGAGQEKE